MEPAASRIRYQGRMFSRVSIIGAAAIWLMAAQWSGTPVTVRAQGLSAPQASSSGADLKPIVDRYCVTCHNGRLKTAGLELDKVDFSRMGDHAEVLEKAVRKLRGGMMPPQSALQPDAATKATLLRGLVTGLDKAEAANPFGGVSKKPRLARVKARMAGGP